MRNVMLIGGIYHPFSEYAEEITALCAARGVETVVTDSVEECASLLDEADLFTLYALRWRMLNHEKYVPHRPRWAYRMDADVAHAISQYAAKGGPILAMHTASICFDTWPGFGHVLGGIWQWGTTFHPPLSRVNVSPVGAHEVVEGLGDFSMDDVIYHHLQREPASVPLLEGCVDGGDNQVVAWAHEYGAGRVVYDALGHDAATIEQPSHRAFLNASIEWLLPNLV